MIYRLYRQHNNCYWSLAVSCNVIVYLLTPYHFPESHTIALNSVFDLRNRAHRVKLACSKIGYEFSLAAATAHSRQLDVSIRAISSLQHKWRHPITLSFLGFNYFFHGFRLCSLSGWVGSIENSKRNVLVLEWLQNTMLFIHTAASRPVGVVTATCVGVLDRCLSPRPHTLWLKHLLVHRWFCLILIAIEGRRGGSTERRLRSIETESELKRTKSSRSATVRVKLTPNDVTSALTNGHHCMHNIVGDAQLVRDTKPWNSFS